MKSNIKILSACLLMLSLLIGLAPAVAAEEAADAAATDCLTAYPDERIWTTMYDEDCTMQNNDWAAFPNRTFSLDYEAPANYALAAGAVWSPTQKELVIWFRANPGVPFAEIDLRVSGRAITADAWRVQTKLDYLTRVFLPLEELDLTVGEQGVTTPLQFSIPYRGQTYRFDGVLIFSETVYSTFYSPSDMLGMRSTDYFTAANTTKYSVVDNQTILTHRGTEKYVALDITVQNLPEVDAAEVNMGAPGSGYNQTVPALRVFLLSGPSDGWKSAGLYLSVYHVKDQGLVLTYYSNGTTVQLPLNQALDEVNGTTVNIAVRWNMETDFANDTAEITYGVNGGIQTTVMYSNPTAQHDISSIDRGFVRYDLVRAEESQVIRAVFGRLLIAEKSEGSEEDLRDILTDAALGYAPRQPEFQVSADGRSVRFLSLVRTEWLEQLEAVGYSVWVRSGDRESAAPVLRTTTRVWSSVMADGQTVAAPDGWCYVAMTVSGLNLPEDTGLLFRISTYARLADGRTDSGVEIALSGEQLAAAWSEPSAPSVEK